MEAKMEKTVIRDTERGEELTLTELRTEYENLKNAGETEAETFEDYLENITDGNGTCEWCNEVFEKSELRKEADLGYLCNGCIHAISSRGEKLNLEF